MLNTKSQSQDFVIDKVNIVKIIPKKKLTLMKNLKVKNTFVKNFEYSKFPSIFQHFTSNLSDMTFFISYKF